MDKESKEQIKIWHKIVVQGLNNGLRQTINDGRKDKKEFWTRRSDLWNYFSKCVMDLMTNQDWRYAEKELKEVAEAGFNMEDGG